LLYVRLIGGVKVTHKEAIEIIKNNYPDRSYMGLREALDLAIKALEKEQN
jgi:20S proteasome alpha/beta subunit